MKSMQMRPRPGRVAGPPGAALALSGFVCLIALLALALGPEYAPRRPNVPVPDNAVELNAGQYLAGRVPFANLSRLGLQDYNQATDTTPRSLTC